ncbi:hypothetical protein SDC9_160182 [bioreactor metagenome]|uniref:Uncharacterized protein n=1 Tax=bioreactor metagenome TaxID=1076179 RepID=A0A645FH74_9ZZZZ
MLFMFISSQITIIHFFQFTRLFMQFVYIDHGEQAPFIEQSDPVAHLLYLIQVVR